MEIRMLISALIICLIMTCRAQERAGMTGIDLSSNFNFQEELHLVPAVFHAIKQHRISLGPLFPVSDNAVPVWGIDMTYKFYPNRLEQLFDLFFLYDTRLIRRKLFRTSTEKGMSWQNYLGYGFHVNLRSIYLSHKIAAGLEQNWFDDLETIYDVNVFVSFGIGYRINLPFKKRKNEE